MEWIKVNIENNIMRIILNRPDKMNSFIQPMAYAVQKALDDAAQDDTVRVVYITGQGQAFCAGQDLPEAINDNGIEMEDIVSLHYNPIILKIKALPKPVVAGVNGVAAGAGANIALACDIVIAHKSARFIQAFSKIGLVPDSGGTYVLPRLIGWARATALMMTGEAVMADEAERIGMIYKSCDEDSFNPFVENLLNTLAHGATKGLGWTKQLLNDAWTNGLEQQLSSESHWQTKAGQSRDFKEGVQAFLEKRKPSFEGK